MSDWADTEASGFLDMIRYGDPATRQTARHIAVEILASKMRLAYERGHYAGVKKSVDLLTNELVQVGGSHSR